MSQEFEVSKGKQEEIDSILDAALDELDDDEKQPPTQPLSVKLEDGYSCRIAPNSEHNSNKETDVAGLNSLLKHLFDGNDGTDHADSSFGAIMQEMQQQIKTEMQAGHREGGSDIDRTISKIIEDMASMGDDTGSLGDQNMLQDMMNEFEKMGGEMNADDMIDGMMGQLLSKDLMYEPMKQVNELFPSWLQKNKGKVSEEEYSNRCMQHECFRKLIHFYETQPDDVEKLMLLMQEVQVYGQPPSEIVMEIAPGLELDVDGAPKMDLLHGGEECRIM